ncbi:MAG: hypothetical protein JRN44_01260 [Nitrososphaerota archaeon]|jgi:hypothetical protein|nr:hypothetical protein [Nitrososphaerota archaeon]MDG6941693.1 hypothetical protein [Nitrososphaerota archaeon]MDG6947134.1 hypothetical protein [Nitrososphaerota archaeon]MDG6951476.1 hypothetical protein [Nitrososphaerota archaeon]
MAGEEGRRKERGVSKYSHLLESDATFRAWYANVLRASHNTGLHYFLRMGRICDELCPVTPKEIGAMNKTELMTFVSTVVSDLEKGVSGVTIHSYVKAIKSWARFNGTKPEERINMTRNLRMRTASWSTPRRSP